MNVTTAFRQVVRRLRSSLSTLTHRYQTARKERADLNQAMQRFEHDRLLRRQKYAASRFDFKDQADIVRKLETDGFAILPGAADREVLLQLRKEVEQHLDAGTCLTPVSKDSVRKPGDLGASNVFLTDEEVARGQRYCRQHTNYITIREPLLSCPSAVPLAFGDLLIDVATGYLDCLPAVGGLNLRKSFANDLAEYDTLYFHCDPNSPKFLKFFFYLNDVDERGGPFCFVRGSHRKKFVGWKAKYRWTYDEIAAAFGKEQIINLTARLGDVVVADTNGFHRGTKILSTDRAMLTVDYVIHEEFGGQQKPFQLRAADYERLSLWQKAAADFLQVTA